MMRAAVIATAVAALSSLLPLGCGEDDEPASPLLARAAEHTLDAGGARFTSRSFRALVDWSVQLSEDGVLDKEGSTYVTYRAATREGGSRPRIGKARQVLVGETTYVRLLPHGEWTRIDVPETKFRLSELLATGRAALDDLAYLRNVQRVGSAVVRGVRTVHYRAESRLDRLADVVRPSDRETARRDLRRLIRNGAKGSGLRTDVWLDAQGRVRRVRERLSLRLPGYDPRPSRARTDLFDFGPKPRIKTPPRANRGISELFD
jgi:hypothetical protein